MKQLRPALVLTLLLLLLTGLIYPGVVLGIGGLAFPHQANGSLIREGGRVVGSDLIGQSLTSPGYFHTRPYLPGRNPDATVEELSQTFRRVSGLPSDAVIPADAVTRSASGVDPHISPRNAELQAARVAKARSLSLDRVRALIARHTEGRSAGILGEPRVHVLRLNLALDRESR